MSMLLIFPPQETVYGTPTLPRLGPAYLSAALDAGGVDHGMLDLSLYSNNWQEVLKTQLKKYRYFGITSTTYEIASASLVARYIRLHLPNASIIVGGSHATLIGKELLMAYPEFDYALKGEGENVLPAYIRLLESGSEDEIKTLPGIISRQGGEIISNNGILIEDLDRLPFPNYQQYELEKYTSSPKALPLLTSRGCPFGCIYCSVGIVMGKKFRYRAPTNIIAEMEYFIGKYGTSIFTLNDDNFTYNVERAKDVCKLIIEKRLNIQWNASNGIRVNNVDEELVSLMKDSGCTELAIGIESCNDNILRRLKKGTNREIIEKAISIIQKYRIPLKGFFLIGSPDETRQDVFNSLEFAKTNIDVARFSMLTPYPGTGLWEWVSENNYWTEANPLEQIINYTHIGEGKTIFETPEFNKSEKEATYQEIYQEWEKFSQNSSFLNRMKFKLRSHPRLYGFARQFYRMTKRITERYIG